MSCCWGLTSITATLLCFRASSSSSLLSSRERASRPASSSRFPSRASSSSRCPPVSVQGEAALPALHSADSQESGVLLWTLSADDPQKAAEHMLTDCFLSTSSCWHVLQTSAAQLSAVLETFPQHFFLLHFLFHVLNVQSVEASSHWFNMFSIKQIVTLTCLSLFPG